MASHPHNYPWHDGHHEHHFVAVAPGGVVIRNSMSKAEAVAQEHPHMDTPPTPAKPENEQAAGVGVSSYGKFAAPYGSIDKTTPSSLLHYPLHDKLQQVDQLVKDHGFQTYFAGGRYGKPDLGKRNYTTGHLMVYDPNPESGGDFGDREYTEAWRKSHELAHALVYPELNRIYGEGRRIGRLGGQRTAREALRAVHWEWLAGHKQRDLLRSIGVNVPDEDFNREMNTLMHDAVHRAVTGKFTEPAGEGFKPHPHKIPLETALNTVRDEAKNLGLQGEHDLLSKYEPNLSHTGANVADDRKLSLPEVLDVLKKGLKEKVDKTTNQLIELRKRELRKAEVGLCISCGELDDPAHCTCLNKAEYCAPGSKMEKVAPPGREDQVKELKGKVANPYAVAWASYDKKDAKKAEEDPAAEESVRNCPACGSANGPMGSLGRLEHFRCRQCGGMYSFDPGLSEKTNAAFGPEPKVLHPSDKKRPAKKTESAYGAGSAPGDTGKGLGTGMPNMALSESVKKNALAGYGPSQPPPGGGGGQGGGAKLPGAMPMLRTEETKAHAGNAFAGDGSPDPGLVRKGDGAIKVKVKVKLPGSKESVKKAAMEGAPGKMAGHAAAQTVSDRHPSPLGGAGGGGPERKSEDYIDLHNANDPEGRIINQGDGSGGRVEETFGKDRSAHKAEPAKGPTVIVIKAEAKDSPAKGKKVPKHPEGTTGAVEEGRDESSSKLPGDKASVIQAKESLAGGNDIGAKKVGKLGKVSPIWSPSKPGSKMPGLPGVTPRSGVGGSGALHPGDVLSMTSLAHPPGAGPKPMGGPVANPAGALKSGDVIQFQSLAGGPPKGSGTAIPKGTSASGAKPTGGLAAHKPAVAGAAMKSEKDPKDNPLHKSMDICALCRKAEHAGMCR